MSNALPNPGNKILVGICSSRANRGRRDAVRETWLARPQDGMECVFFLGSDAPLPEEPDTVVLECPDDYDHLPSKVLKFFSHCLENFDFEWLFKCDDDTYVALDRLRDLVSPEFDLIGNGFLNTRGAPSGGAGYLLSRRMVELLASASGLPATGAEDMVVGQAAIRLGARVHATERLCWNNGGYPAQDNTIVTSHWCTPDRLRVIHANLAETAEIIEVSHPHWTDRISLLPGGYFFRHSSGCSGSWREDPAGNIFLDWFDWEGEVIVPESHPDGEDAETPAVLRCVSYPKDSLAAHAPGEAPEGIPAIPPGQGVTPDGLAGPKHVAVFLTTSGYGLPHLDRFLELNPGIPICVACAEIAPEGNARTRAWRNCDIPIRNWWFTQGCHLRFQYAVFLEWDVLFDSDIRSIFPGDCDFYCKDLKKPGMPWDWFDHIDRLPESLQAHATGTPPMAVIRVSRRCLEAVFSHPDADEAYRRDIQAELRFASLAVACGFEPARVPGTLPHVTCWTASVGFGPAVWHSVKQRQHEFLRLPAGSGARTPE